MSLLIPPKKTLNLYMRTINCYLLFTLEKKPAVAQIRLQFHSQRGDEMQKKVDSLKEEFNIHPPSSNPPKKHGEKTKGVSSSMHHRTRCYHVTAFVSGF